jgi:glutamine synthetase adenylyltransferase
LCLARDNGALPAEAASLLIDNYRKLRRFEGILRRWSYVGETTLPDDPAPMYRVAVRCGFRNAEAFLQAVERYRAGLRRVYQQVFSSVGGSPIGRCEKACTRVPRACSIWGET